MSKRLAFVFHVNGNLSQRLFEEAMLRRPIPKLDCLWHLWQLSADFGMFEQQSPLRQDHNNTSNRRPILQILRLGFKSLGLTRRFHGHGIQYMLAPHKKPENSTARL